jgi:stress response protein SCP2
MKAPQRTTVLNYIQTSLLIFFLITKSTFSGCPPYILPEIPTASDYNTILYVDPQAPTGGNGTIDKPYNTINGLTITPNTAYLIKAGTILYERVDRVWKNNMVGRYGEGDRPVVNHGFRFNEGVDGIVVRDLRIVREGTGTSGTASASSIFVNYGTPRNITIAFCDIEGIENPSMEYAYRYPAFGSTGAAGGSWVFYNNRIGNIGSKAFYTAAPNYVFVRNYVYNINRGAWTGEERDQESGIGHGNAFSYRFWRENAYIAGNYFDGYRDFDHSIMYAGKGIFGIMAGMDDLTPNNMVIEYNTIIGAPGITSTGGGSLYYDPPNETIFRYNVIDGSIKGQHHGLINIVGSQWATRLTYESGSSIWGIRNNHLIKATSNQDISWGTDSEAYIREEGRNNIIYDSWDAYNTDYEKESWGSDIDPDAFWVEFNCDTEYFNVEFDILDQQGEVIPQATITFAGKTNPIGDYSFTGIAPGTYSYIVSSPGFQNLTVTNLEIIDNTTISVQLTPIPVYSVIFNVISTGGTPINNAVISFNGITNPAGDYSFTAIPAGTYSYSVSATGYQVVSSNNLKIVENTSVQIQMTSVPPTTYSLSFVVTSDAGTLITNAVVTFNGVTNPEGNYSFTNIIAGTYSYSVSASGYQNKSVSNFQVTQNTSVAVQLDPVPLSVYTINFAVTSDTGAPITNAVVTFNGVTNPEGNYSFSNIIAGTYSYSVSASGYQNKSVSNFQVTQNTSVAVQLDPLPPSAYTINFAVTSDAGTPIINAVVTFNGVTNPEGNYSFTNIIAGTYSYSVSASGYQNKSVSNFQVTQNTSVAVQLDPVPPSAYTINFAVTSDTGAPITNAVVTFNGVTNAEGNYSFSNIIAGTYSYSVSASGYQNKSVNNFLVTQNATVAVQLDPLPPSAYTINFAVTSDAGTPIINAVVTFNGVTNPEGNYSFTNIIAGTYSYSVSASGYQNKSVSNFQVTQNTSVVVQLDPVPPSAYTINFAVTSDTGAPITNAVVTFNGVTNAEGNYSFSNIIAGTYSYSVSASGYQNKSVNNFLVTQNATVAVQLDPLPPSAYTINFAVTSDAGTPITNAVVTFNGVTNPEGNYSFTNIIAGTYSYSVSASGYQMVTTAYLLVNQDTTVLVPLNSENHFNDEVVSITVKSDPPGMAFISGAGVYLVSNEVKISVEPIVDEFVFIGWKENDQIITKEETLNFIANNDREIIASFKPISRGFNILAQASFEDAGEISGIGYYSKGEIASIYYSDNQKYVFKGWINRAGQVVSRQNPFSFEVNRNIELTALLDVVEYNENDRLMVYPNPSNGLVFVKNTFIEDADIVVFNSSGNPVQNRKMISNDNMIDLTELPPGMYLLQFRFLNETIVRKILLN